MAAGKKGNRTSKLDARSRRVLAEVRETVSEADALIAESKAVRREVREAHRARKQAIREARRAAGKIARADAATKRAKTRLKRSTTRLKPALNPQTHKISLSDRLAFTRNGRKALHRKRKTNRLMDLPEKRLKIQDKKYLAAQAIIDKALETTGIKLTENLREKLVTSLSKQDTTELAHDVKFLTHLEQNLQMLHNAEYKTEHDYDSRRDETVMRSQAGRLSSRTLGSRVEKGRYGSEIVEQDPSLVMDALVETSKTKVSLDAINKKHDVSYAKSKAAELERLKEREEKMEVALDDSGFSGKSPTTKKSSVTKVQKKKRTMMQRLSAMVSYLTGNAKSGSTSATKFPESGRGPAKERSGGREK